MRDYATFLVFGSLCVLGCSSAGNPPPTPASSAGTGAAVTTDQPAAVSSAAAGAGWPGASAGRLAPPATPTTTGGSSASGTAGASTPTGNAGTSGSVATGSAGTTAAGSGAAAGGASGQSTAGSAGSSAMGGSGTTTEPSFQAVYANVLLMMCPSCHMAGGVFGSPDLSTPELAYSSLVNKDAAPAMPGVCGGKGKLVTPGNCETSLLYNKVSQATPSCGRRMPLASSTVPQSGIDELCAWIRAGAKQN